MRSHEELDQLSAYLDGELDALDRTRVDAHLLTCEECRTTLEGLRATLADLATLEEPAPSPQDSWALRAAIRRARRTTPRWQRVAWAAGAAAAAVIAIVAIVQRPGGDRQELAAGGAAREIGVPVLQTDRNFDPSSAQAHLLDVAGLVPGGGTAFAGGGTSDAKGPAAGPPRVITPLSESENLYSSVERTDELDRCAGVARSATQTLLEAVRYELASFDGKPAYLLFFRTAERFELWVMARGSCEVLFLAQAAV